ncbi:gastrin [Perognathus longimembris pacificus]|uniref:gastrin n=1 Tax=Perognathus longimembris pacificus TaxID=214514 RepID=UPI00201969BA|nr:gastrin [Perognathus longimembris pacificus]
MLRPAVYSLVFVLALATITQASWKPRSQLQGSPSDPAAIRGLKPHWPDQVGPASPHRRQLGAQGLPSLIADLSKKQGPWMEEEEEAYGWMDFGRRSAEETDPHP